MMPKDRFLPPVARRGAPREPVSFPPLEGVILLFRRAQSDDAAAFEPLYHIFEPLLLRAVADHGDGASRADLLGEADLILHRLILKYEPEREVHPLTYMRSALPAAIERFAQREFQKARRETPASGLADADEGAEQPGAILEALPPWSHAPAASTTYGQDPEQAALSSLTWREALASLPARQRRVLLLRGSGFSSEEAATAMHVRADACRQLLHRARAHLQRAIDE
jgi:RNA polymerase sigma factor (sigma-70 family)